MSKDSLPKWYRSRHCIISKRLKGVLINVWPKYAFSFKLRNLKYGEHINLDEAFQRLGTKRWLDIGFGTGTSLIFLCESRPDDDFLGCEIYRNGHALVADTLDKRQITNVRLVASAAEKFLDRHCTPQSFDYICMFFPDPLVTWLMNEDFCKALEAAIRPGGVFCFATDVDDYAVYCIKVLVESSHFRIATISCSGTTILSSWKPTDGDTPDATQLLTTQVLSLFPESQEMHFCGSDTVAPPPEKVNTLQHDTLYLHVVRPEWRPVTHFESKALEENRKVWDILCVYY